LPSSFNNHNGFSCLPFGAKLFERAVRIPLLDAAENIFRSFSWSGRVLFYLLSSLLLVSSVTLLFLLNDRLLLPTPAPGGMLSEGIVGSPRFINPVLAISDADRDLTALVYSGLLRATPRGEYLPDLAQSYTVSPDGLTYTFYLREDASFHDGRPLRAHDVVFTVMRAQDPAIKSPIRANWDGVGTAALDERTVEFTLKTPYAPFIENATLGILPAHLWEGVSAEEFLFSELNVSPVGSGPFKIRSIERTTSGIPSSYTLTPFDSYAAGKPYLSSFVLRFYQNEAALIEALKKGDVEAASGISPSALSDLQEFNLVRSPLNRVFGVFFNENQSEVLREKEVRAALERAVDRQELVDVVLGGYGTPLEGPVPPALEPRSTAVQPASGVDAESAGESRTTVARELLREEGWEIGEDGVLTRRSGSGSDAQTLRLEFSLSTGNVPELHAAAQYLQEQWEEMGARVEIKVFEQGDLSQNVIRPRKYDALLFGEVIGRELDLFAFWHSSQRNDPGLNVALYTNTATDEILEKLRQTQEERERQELIASLKAQLREDIPAIFLYTPDFVYTMPQDVAGFELGFIEKPSDRFLAVSRWHRNVDYVWPFFLN
jgi:peptide/nickel transport system substrate-binding protein